MNCWIWIILLWCCRGKDGLWNNGMYGRGRMGGRSGNGGCGCDDSPCDADFSGRGRSGCGCDNDMMQNRGFAGFGDNATCGCEEKESCQR